MRYVDSDFKQHLLQRQADIDRALSTFIKVEPPSKERTVADKVKDAGPLLERIVKLHFLRHRLGLFYPYSRSQERYVEPDATTNELIDLLHKTLMRAKASVDSWGGQLYFVYLPERDRYIDASVVYYRDQVLRAVKEVGIPLIDIHPAFRVQDDPLALFPLRRIGHYNGRGHYIVAEEVLRHISQN